MARKSKKQGNGAYGDSMQGGFVPASQRHTPKRGGLSLPSLEMTPAAVGPQDSYEQYSRASADYSQRKHSMSKGKKVLLGFLIVVLVAAIAALGVYVYKEIQKNLINQDLHNLSQEELMAVDDELTGHTTFDAPFTLLLLGSDARDGEPYMGARADTIILTRIDPIKNVISMVSIPRDTRIELESGYYDKFNAAYAYGGPSGTIAAVKKLCGVDIDHYAEVNFEGLVGLIDAIGGIDVMVDETVDDPDAGPVVVPKGQQHLNGEAALTFSRSRAYADGDYTRVSNQRKVIEAIAHRGLEAPASELMGLVKSATGFLTTDSAMDVDFIYSLADQMRHNNDEPITIKTTTLPSGTTSISGISYVIADKAGVAELMEIFLAGGDVSQALKQSSLESDVAAAGGGAIVYLPQATVYEEPAYTPPADTTYYPPAPDYSDPGYGGGSTVVDPGTGGDLGGDPGGTEVIDPGSGI